MNAKPSPVKKRRIKQPPILFEKTQRLITPLSSTLGAPVISYWNNPRGAVCHNDVVAIPRKTLFQHVQPLVVGAIDHAESLSIMLCKELLSYHITNAHTVDAIAASLNSKYSSRSFPILFEEAHRIGLQVQHMEKCINRMLLELNEVYSEMRQKATTDFDDIHAHSNEIINILESENVRIYFQHDKEWFYRSEERRWITMNDKSGWCKTVRCNGATACTMLHIA